MDIEQAEFLIQQASGTLLAEVSDWQEQGRNELRIRGDLEKRFTPEECRAVLDCARSRHRHSEKFRDASSWLLTSTAAEQASHFLLAQWRAKELSSRFGDIPLTEVGCGIGSDTVSLSRHFELTGYEMDAARVALCRQNLQVLGGKAWTIHHEEVRLQDLRGGLLYCDPARRSHKRLMSPDEWSPPLPLLFGSVKRHKGVAVKVAPGILRNDLKHDRVKVEIDFLSVVGQLKEAMLYLREAEVDSPPTQRAILFHGEDITVLQASDHRLTFSTPEEGRYILNPDPAILRADLLNTMAEMVGAEGVHPKIGYLTCHQPAPVQLGASFLVEDTFSLDWKSLKKQIHSRKWTEYEYLGRGVPFSQPDVRKRLGKLKRKPNQAALRGSVLIYREDTGYRVVLGRRTERETKSLR